MCEPLRFPLSRLRPQNNPNHTTPPVLWGQDAFLFPSLSLSFFLAIPSLIVVLTSSNTRKTPLLLPLSFVCCLSTNTRLFEQKGNCGSSLCRLEFEEWQLLIRSTNLNQEVLFRDSPAHKPVVLESVMICIVLCLIIQDLCAALCQTLELSP